MVPALFVALASDSEALVQAWLQPRALYEHPRREELAGRLSASVRDALSYLPSQEVRIAVLPFAGELPSLLLLVSSLVATLDGALPRRRPPPLALPELPQGTPTSLSEAPDSGEHPLFAEIGAVYGSERVPSVLRSLARRGLLEEAWSSIGPYLSSPAGRAHADRLARARLALALELPEIAFFSVERARPVLAQFRRALPLNLIFARACAP